MRWERVSQSPEKVDRLSMDEHNADEKMLGVGQVAKRWGVGVERVRQLINVGALRGAFEIPSSGRYGKAIRIPLQAVMDAERRWQCVPEESQRRRPSRGQTELRHLDLSDDAKDSYHEQASDEIGSN